MASTKAVYASLKMLAHNFAGDVTREKAELWDAALRDVPDEALAVAIPKVIATHTGSFLPPVAVVRDAAGVNSQPVLDFEVALTRISDLGYHNPNRGWIYPRVQEVRSKLGDLIGDAYALAGGQRIFADDEVSRSIAQREFRQELNRQAQSRGLLALPPGPPQLSPSDAAQERARRAFRNPPSARAHSGATLIGDVIRSLLPEAPAEHPDKTKHPGQPMTPAETASTP